MSLLPSDKFIETFSPLRDVKDCEFIRAHQALNFFDFWDALEKDLGRECTPFGEQSGLQPNAWPDL
jgi:hypothetical protein